MFYRRCRRQAASRGAAAVELAVLLPVLGFLLVVTVDYARVFYYSLTITNCARNAAYYECDPAARAESPYASARDAALADAGDLKPAPTVTTSTGAGQVAVTVTYPFQTIMNYPGVPKTINLARTVRMDLAPAVPKTD
jgi:Flp pilus assembly protein TadG